MYSGALRLVEQLAGAAEAERVGRELAYPGWSRGGATDIPALRWAPRDLAYLLTHPTSFWKQVATRTLATWPAKRAGPQFRNAFP